MPRLAYLDNAELASRLIQEILLTYDTGLTQIPGGGKGVYLDSDHVLLWSTEKTYRLVQGDWVEIPPASIPLAGYLKVLRESLAKRQVLIKKRITRLVQSSDNIDLLMKAIDSGDREQISLRLADLR